MPGVSGLLDKVEPPIGFAFSNAQAAIGSFFYQTVKSVGRHFLQTPQGALRPPFACLFGASFPCPKALYRRLIQGAAELAQYVK